MADVRRERFELALDLLRSSDWGMFEQLASEFLVPEFGQLRTMANPSGDRGRDATLFTPQDSQSIIQLVAEAGPASRAYLHRVADSYTLLAFLREMPDVQAAMVKMFSHGEIWLDTSMVLPLMAEELIDDLESRRFTAMLSKSADYSFD
jgi:hypothetical protein